MGIKEQEKIPWENIKLNSFLKSILITCIQIMIHPGKSFLKTKDKQNKWYVYLFYALIMIMFMSIIGLLWNVFLHHTSPDINLKYILTHVLYLPFMIILVLVIQIILVYVCLKFILKLELNLISLLRIYSYATSVFVLCIIPTALMLPVILIWYLIIIYYGLINTFEIKKYSAVMVIVASIMIPPLIATLFKQVTGSV